MVYIAMEAPVTELRRGGGGGGGGGVLAALQFHLVQ